MDCQAIALGFIEAQSKPAPAYSGLRHLCRYRKKLIQKATAEKNRVHKVLEDANIKLVSLAAGIFMVSDRAILEAIIARDLDPEKTVELTRGKLQQKLPQVVNALEGLTTEHHKFLLRMHLEHLAYL